MSFSRCLRCSQSYPINRALPPPFRAPAPKVKASGSLIFLPPDLANFRYRPGDLEDVVGARAGALIAEFPEPRTRNWIMAVAGAGLDGVLVVDVNSKEQDSEICGCFNIGCWFKRNWNAGPLLPCLPR